jgi:hypothetical protein
MIGGLNWELLIEYFICGELMICLCRFIHEFTWVKIFLIWLVTIFKGVCHVLHEVLIMGQCKEDSLVLNCLLYVGSTSNTRFMG